MTNCIGANGKYTVEKFDFEFYARKKKQIRNETENDFSKAFIS